MEISRWREPPEHENQSFAPRQGRWKTRDILPACYFSPSSARPGLALPGTGTGGCRHRLISDQPSGLPRRFGELVTVPGQRTLDPGKHRQHFEEREVP